ncbi:hypothetical protein BpHYR1_005783, partial [Brachionus plicatilis]
FDYSLSQQNLIHITEKIISGQTRLLYHNSFLQKFLRKLRNDSNSQNARASLYLFGSLPSHFIFNLIRFQDIINSKSSLSFFEFQHVNRYLNLTFLHQGSEELEKSNLLLLNRFISKILNHGKFLFLKEGKSNLSKIDKVEGYNKENFF